MLNRVPHLHSPFETNFDHLNTPEKDKGLVLVTQVYSPTNVDARMAVAAAIVENIANPAFTDIVLFVDVGSISNKTISHAAAQEVLLSLLRAYLDNRDRVERDGNGGIPGCGRLRRCDDSTKKGFHCSP